VLPKHERERFAPTQFTLQPPPRPETEEDSCQCGIRCKKDCYTISEPLMQSTCMRLCDGRCATAGSDKDSPAHSDAPIRVGLTECDEYLNSWRTCRPSDAKQIKDMAERIAGLVEASSDHAETIALCAWIPIGLQESRNPKQRG
jgi:hypothetical protein